MNNKNNNNHNEINILGFGPMRLPIADAEKQKTYYRPKTRSRLFGRIINRIKQAKSSKTTECNPCCCDNCC